MFHSTCQQSPRRPHARLLIALFLGAALLASGTTALAEGSTPTAPAATPAAVGPSVQNGLQTLDRLELTLAPEWDQPMPQVFGDIAGSLVNQGTQPVSGQEISVRLPKNGRLNSVCELEGDPREVPEPKHDTLAADQVQVTDKGDYLLVSWKMTKTVEPGKRYPFHVEFYFSGLTGGPDKTVTYSYDPTYAAPALTVAVAEPKGATAFKTTLGEGTVETGGDGLKYHVYNLPAVRPGQPVPIQVSYNRASNEASLPPPTASGSQGSGTQGGQGSGTTGTSGGDNYAPLLVGLAVVLGLAGLFVMSGRQQPGRAGSRTVAATAQLGGSAAASRRERRAAELGRPVSGSGQVSGSRQAPGARPVQGKAAPVKTTQAKLTQTKPAQGDPRTRALELYQSGQIGEDVYRAIVAQIDAEEGR